MHVELTIETHCQECGAVFKGHHLLCVHIKSAHMPVRQYYDKWVKKPGEGKCLHCGLPTGFAGFSKGYETFCCKSCARKYQDAHATETKIECKECGEVFVGRNRNIASTRFGSHLNKAHKMKPKDYYDKWLKKPDEGKCRLCGKPTAFLKLSAGYQTFCSNKCSHAAAKQNLDKVQTEMREYRAEQLQIVKTDEMIQEEWKQEIARRLAEFEGDRETSYHAESDLTGTFATETSCLARIFI